MNQGKFLFIYNSRPLTRATLSITALLHVLPLPGGLRLTRNRKLFSRMFQLYCAILLQCLQRVGTRKGNCPGGSCSFNRRGLYIIAFTAEQVYYYSCKQICKRQIFHREDSKTIIFREYFVQYEIIEENEFSLIIKNIGLFVSNTPFNEPRNKFCYTGTGKS
ncbi:hypothetical protein BH10BAC3_BH10BAC3_39690 [soil metagenome]